jgi:hypothetical protein
MWGIQRNSIVRAAQRTSGTSQRHSERDPVDLLASPREDFERRIIFGPSSGVFNSSKVDSICQCALVGEDVLAHRVLLRVEDGGATCAVVNSRHMRLRPRTGITHQTGDRDSSAIYSDVAQRKVI